MYIAISLIKESKKMKERIREEQWLELHLSRYPIEDIFMLSNPGDCGQRLLIKMDKIHMICYFLQCIKKFLSDIISRAFTYVGY